MTRPLVKIHNTQTDEITEREMNDAEYDKYLAQQEKFAQMEAIAEETAAKKAAAEAKLAALGLTADDLKALGLG